MILVILSKKRLASGLELSRVSSRSRPWRSRQHPWSLQQRWTSGFGCL